MIKLIMEEYSSTELVLNKDSVVTLTVDGKAYELERNGFSSKEGESPAFNHTTGKIDTRWSNEIEVQFIATPKETTK